MFVLVFCSTISIYIKLSLHIEQMRSTYLKYIIKYI